MHPAQHHVQKEDNLVMVTNQPLCNQLLAYLSSQLKAWLWSNPELDLTIYIIHKVNQIIISIIFLKKTHRNVVPSGEQKLQKSPSSSYLSVFLRALMAIHRLSKCTKAYLFSRPVLAGGSTTPVICPLCSNSLFSCSLVTFAGKFSMQSVFTYMKANSKHLHSQKKSMEQK